MSRSRKKHPVTSWCNGSEKFDKRKNNRRLRKRCNDLLRQGREDLPTMKDVSDPWAMKKDGKHWMKPDDYGYEDEMRK